MRVILQLEELGKIRVYDLFDEDDVERFAEDADEPELAADTPAAGAAAEEKQTPFANLRELLDRKDERGPASGE